MSARQRLEVKMKSGAVLVGPAWVRSGRHFHPGTRPQGRSFARDSVQRCVSSEERWTRPEKWLVGITIFVLMGAMSALLGP